MIAGLLNIQSHVGGFGCLSKSDFLNGFNKLLFTMLICIKHNLAYIFLFSILVTVLGIPRMQAQTYNFTITGGNWSQTIAATSITEAGLDYDPDTRTSAANQTRLTYRRSGGGATGRNFTVTVQVHKTNTTWDDQIELWVRRTGDGTEPAPACTSGGFVSGGTSWQQVTNTATSFFTGRCRRSNVPIQLEIRNISVVVPTGTKTTTITYTATFVQL